MSDASNRSGFVICGGTERGSHLPGQSAHVRNRDGCSPRSSQNGAYATLVLRRRQRIHSSWPGSSRLRLRPSLRSRGMGRRGARRHPRAISHIRPNILGPSPMAFPPASSQPNSSGPHRSVLVASRSIGDRRAQLFVRCRRDFETQQVKSKEIWLTNRAQALIPIRSSGR
jgi:hypothetical protein